jgi:hypothetical protein
MLRFPPVVTVGTMRSVVGAFARAFSRKERFAVVVDGSAIVKFPNAAARLVVTDWLADPQRAELERTYSVGAAVVMTSGPMRALVAMFHLVRRPISPQHWTPDRTDAFEWAQSRLVKEGIAPTNAMAALGVELKASRAGAQRRA